MNKEQLRKARLSLNLSQEGFGKELGLSREMVNRMEKGHKEINKRTNLAVKYLLSKGN